jgi:hypothetical protein
MKKPIPAWRCLLVLACLTSLPAPAATTPEATVREYMTAVKERGFSAVAEYLHPQQRDRFREMMIPVVRAAHDKGDRQFIDLIAGKEKTLKDVEAMTSTQFTNAFMVAVGDLIGKIDFKSLDVLGHVTEGDVIHVVTRIGVEVQGIESRKMQVVSCKSDGKDYKLMLTGEIENLASALSRQK